MKIHILLIALLGLAVVGKGQAAATAATVIINTNTTISATHQAQQNMQAAQRANQTHASTMTVPNDTAMLHKKPKPQQKRHTPPSIPIGNDGLEDSLPSGENLPIEAERSVSRLQMMLLRDNRTDTAKWYLKAILAHWTFIWYTNRQWMLVGGNYALPNGKFVPGYISVENPHHEYVFRAYGAGKKTEPCKTN